MVAKDQGMFFQLANFKLQRSAKQAFGFFVAYWLLGILIGALVGGMIGALVQPATFDEGYELGFRLASFIMPLYILLIGYAVFSQKKFFNDFKAILALVVALLAALVFAPLSIFIVSYYTTKKPNK